MPIKNYRTSFAARLMLILAVLQILFVAFEAAGVIHGADEDKNHHEIVMSDAAGQASNLHAASDIDEDPCDHCCHCHGHGTHFSLQPNQYVLIITPTSAVILPKENHFQTHYLHTIHRPPIA